MKQTTTEIFIEIEETICVKSAKGRKTKGVESEKEDLNPVIEICPHCHQAIFEPQTIETQGEKNYENS